MTEHTAHYPAPVRGEISTSTVVISLNGNATTYHEAGTTWEDPGATIDGVGIGQVGGSVSGTVDPDTLGTYTLTYTHPNAVTVVRTVIVQDTIAPVMTIQGRTQSFAFTFEEGSLNINLAFNPSATDSFEGDVTARIVQSGDTLDINTPGVYELHWDCDDTSGNAVRRITFTYTIIADAPDVTAPVIYGPGLTTLISAITWTNGNALTPTTAFNAIMPEAQDEVDGPITLTSANITIAGAVDTDVDATYSNGITITVEDEATNEATATIHVIVQTPAASSELETITLLGRNNQAITTPYVTMGLPIKPGALTAASQTIEIRKITATEAVEIIPCQMDNEVTVATDGTVNFCTIAFKGVSLLAGPGNEQKYSVHVITGSKDTDFRSGESEATSIATVQAENWTIDFTGDVTGTASLSDAFDETSPDQMRLTRSGPLLREWTGWDMAGAHDDIYARWYARLNNDNTVEVAAAICNGWTPDLDETVEDYTVSWSLKKGGVEQSSGSSGRLAGFMWVHICGADTRWENQEPYFVAHETTVNGSQNYLQQTYCFMPYAASDPALMSLPGPLSYAWNGSFGSGFAGNVDKDMGGTGDRDDIGPLTQWSTRALIAQHWSTDQIDKVNGLYLAHSGQGFREPLTGEISTTNTLDYSADGLGSVDRSYHKQGETWTRAWSDGWGGSGTSASHHPELNFSQYAMCGDVRFFELHQNTLAAFQMYGTPSHRNGLVVNSPVYGNVTYNGISSGRGQTQIRSQAWYMRTLGNHYWICPDDHPARNYITFKNTNEWQYLDAVMHTPEADGGHFDGMRNLGAYRTEFTAHSSSDFQQDRVLPWHMDFLGAISGWGFLRGYVPQLWMDNVFTKYCTGRHVQGCQYWGYPNRMLVWRTPARPNGFARDWSEVWCHDSSPADTFSTLDPATCPTELYGQFGFHATPQEPWKWYPPVGWMVSGIGEYITSEGVGSFPDAAITLAYLEYYCEHEALHVNSSSGPDANKFANSPKYFVFNPNRTPIAWE